MNFNVKITLRLKNYKLYSKDDYWHAKSKFDVYSE